MKLRLFMEQTRLKQHLFLPLSRPAFAATVFSCVVHICALGLSGAMMLTQGERVSTSVKVALLQQAMPLPVGEKETHGAPEPTPIAPPAPAPPPPLVKPEPKVKKTPEKPPRPPAPLVKKPPPQVVPAPPPPEPLPQLSTFALPAENETATTGTRQNEDGTATGHASNSDKTGSPVRNEAGRGGGAGGISARPDYGVNPKPPYPLIARRLGTQGVVLLRVHVRADGSVAEAEIKQSSGSTLLDDSALRTVRESWRFLPARLDGVPVESWVEVPIRFVLGDA
jgi:protein TonB